MKNKKNPNGQSLLAQNCSLIEGVFTSAAGWSMSQRKGKRSVCTGIAQSSLRRAIVYPMMLDIMADGVFGIATYPKKIPQELYSLVCQELNRKNCTTRYGKYLLHESSGEVKFRVFFSNADVRDNKDEALSLLTALPAMMLDNLLEELDGLLTKDRPVKARR